MTILDGPMGALARTLVGTFGAPAAILRPPVHGEYDPSTGDVRSYDDDPDSVPCSIVWDDPKGRSDMFGDTLVQTGDRVAIVARESLGFRPIQGEDRLVVDSVGYEIVEVRAYSSGAQDAAFALLVRPA